MPINQDLPPLSLKHKHAALYGLARAGLTYADCAAFFGQLQEDDELYFVKKAQELHHEEGEVEIDAYAMVSAAEPEKGAYVQAWIWVERDE